MPIVNLVNRSSTATQLVLTTQPSAVAGSAIAFPQQPVLEAQDAQGVKVSTFTGAVTASRASGANTAIGGTLTVNAIAGVISFADLQLILTNATPSGEAITLSFASSGLTSAISNSITAYEYPEPVYGGSGLFYQGNSNNGSYADAFTSALAEQPGPDALQYSAYPSALISGPAATSFTDLVIHPSDPTLVSSAAHPFVSRPPTADSQTQGALYRNSLKITGGTEFTAGIRTIIEIADDGTGSWAKLDAAAGTVGSTGGIATSNAVDSISHVILSPGRLGGKVLRAHNIQPDGPLGITLSRGTTDTNLKNTAGTFRIYGTLYNLALNNAGTSFGALGTIPADQWGLLAVDVDTSGVLSFVPAAASFTTGYASEALAKAAFPNRQLGKCRLGYLTLQTAAGQSWIAASDALAGGSSGHPASTTNFAAFGGTAIQGGADWLLYKKNGSVPTPITLGQTFYRTTYHRLGGVYNGVDYATKFFRAPTDLHTAGDAPQWSLHGGGASFGAPKNIIWQFYDHAVTTVNNAAQPVGPWFEDMLGDGTWHRFAWQYKAASAVGANDGIARMWIDGVNVLNVCPATVGVTPPGGYKAWCIQSEVNMIPAFGRVESPAVGGAQSTNTNATWDHDTSIDDDISWAL